MKLFLIRHGESEANRKMIYAGQSDAKLTELGCEQARAIRLILENIPFDKVYSSDLSRAYDTQSLALPGFHAELTPLLREYDVGSLEGKPFLTMAQRTNCEDARDYTPYGGENTEMVNQRIRKFLNMLEENPADYVAAFAHNGVMCSTLSVVLGAAYEYAAVRSGNCAIHVFDFDGKMWRLAAWNYMKPV